MSTNTIQNRPYLDHPQRAQLLLSYHGRAVALAQKLLQAGVAPAMVYPYDLPKLTAQVREGIAVTTALVLSSQGEPVLTVTMHRHGSLLGPPSIWSLLVDEQRVLAGMPTHTEQIAASVRAIETSHAMLAELGALLVYPQLAGHLCTDNRLPKLQELEVPGDWVVVTPEMRRVLNAYFAHVARTGHPGISRPLYQHPVPTDDALIYLGPKHVPVDRDWLGSLDATTRKRFMKGDCGCSQMDVDEFEAGLRLTAAVDTATHVKVDEMHVAIGMQLRADAAPSE